MVKKVFSGSLNLLAGALVITILAACAPIGPHGGGGGQQGQDQEHSDHRGGGHQTSEHRDNHKNSDW